MEGTIAQLICLFLVVYLVYAERKRVNRRNLAARILASILAVLSLLFLLIPIHYQVNDSPTEQVYLLTEGASLDSVKSGTVLSLDPRISEQANRMAGQENKETENAQQVHFIPDLHYYLREHPHVRKLTVFGHGLPEQEWKQLEHYGLDFHPSPVPKGVISCLWEPELTGTERLHVQGTYHNSDSIPVKLILYALGADLDSVWIRPGGNGRFLLTNQPVQQGKVRYELISMVGADTLSKDPIPFQVKAEQRAKILFLASSPDFEYKFLKNWLAENQYPVILRARITRDKFSTDFLNTPKQNVNRIQPALLKEFDLVVADEDELASLRQDELAALETEVKAGMGLFIRMGEQPFTSPLISRFTRYQSSFEQNTKRRVSLLQDTTSLSPLAVVPRTLLKGASDQQALVSEVGGKILVGSRLEGMGKVTMSTLLATYPWVLAGQSSDYSLFWSSLLSNGARKKDVGTAWSMFPQFPSKGQKSRIAFSSTSQGIPDLLLNASRLSPRQNIELPFQWDVDVWPKKGGWNSLHVEQLEHFFFVYDQQDWRTVRAHDKIQSSNSFIKNRVTLESGTQQNPQQERTIPKGWFFLIFLVAVSFLWYESRVLSTRS